MAEQRKLWHQLVALYAPSRDEMQAANELYDAYQRYGTIQKTCRSILGVSDATIAYFYHRIAEHETLDSPVSDCPDSSWMIESDFCFVNVRATGLNDKLGTFIQATKLLPVIRANAIHLAPFTLSDFSIVYAIQSIKSIARQVVDPWLVKQGFSAEDQLQALVDAAHLLKKTIGFDVEPHVTQFAIPVLMHPEMFRWIKLYQHDKRWLDYYLSMEDMLKEKYQRTLVEAVKCIVRDTLHREELETLEILEGDQEATIQHKRQIYLEIVHTLIHKGYWTLLSHTWSGVGVPSFAHYNSENNYPEFMYLDRQRMDPGDKIFGILTPYSFYNDMPPNRIPDQPLPPNQDAIDYYQNIFPRWRDRYGFDFVRYDSVDHIFDSTLDGNPNAPISDRPTPGILQGAIARSKSTEKPYIGSLAERMGTEAREYAGIGFDLMLGSDMLETIDKRHMKKTFALYDQLSQLNRQLETPFAITYALDTHDTGDPYLFGEPLLMRVGAQGVQLRHFISRFVSCGKARRPKYEVMGLQDMSHGLYAANVSEKNLIWVGDKGHNRTYHIIEDIYEKYRDFLSQAEIVSRTIKRSYAWWLIQFENQLLVPVMSLEQAEDPKDVRDLTINLSPWMNGGKLEAARYDFTSHRGALLTLSDGKIRIPHLRYRSFALFEVRA